MENTYVDENGTFIGEPPMKWTEVHVDHDTPISDEGIIAVAMVAALGQGFLNSQMHRTETMMSAEPTTRPETRVDYAA